MNEELTIEAIFELAVAKSLKLPTWSWKRLQIYNGFTHEQRVRKWQALHLARELGLITPAAHYPCSVCAAEAPNVTISYHSEDYSSMTGHYPVCRRCHTLIHTRHLKQRAWQELINQYGNGMRWFEKFT